MATPQENLNSTIKFLCSYGGKILPRPSDGQLRYVGGHTRVISVHRSVSFSELMMKLGDLCGYSVTLRCQLPDEDLDVLVSIKSDEDLVNVIEEYDKASLIFMREFKIRAILPPPKSNLSPSPTCSSSSSSGTDLCPSNSDRLRSPTMAAIPRCPARKNQYAVVRECHRYPCHLQANSRLPLPYLSQPSNHWH